MAVDFDRECSVYRNVFDNRGNFVDAESGEVITSISVGEFCLSDRWRPAVEHLRELRQRFGKEAKQMEEYKLTKQLLPSATLSGLFELRESVDPHTGVSELKSRVTDHLKQHTGFLCIDIDAQDNVNLGGMGVIRRTLRYRPEVALLMQSCSGTGFFALIPLAYPERHKEQFAAIRRDWASIGITIDRQCGDVTRVRIASYDEHPYVNVNAIPYTGLLSSGITAPVTMRRQTTTPLERTIDSTIDKVEKLVTKLERLNIDITASYADWYKVGFALATLPEPWGRHFFHRVSRLCSKYNEGECERKFTLLRNPRSVGIGTFFTICKNYGVTLH